MGGDEDEDGRERKPSHPQKLFILSFPLYVLPSQSS